MRFQTPLAATLTMATLFVAGAPAAAQTQQAVISAPRPSPSPRVDIHAACPDVAETLNRELGPATLMHGKSGTVRVEFSLAADQPIDVVSRGGPREYRESIRRAVRQLTCDRSAGGSRFVFEIRFELDAPSDAPRRLAHLVIQ